MSSTYNFANNSNSLSSPNLFKTEIALYTQNEANALQHWVLGQENVLTMVSALQKTEMSPEVCGQVLREVIDKNASLYAKKRLAECVGGRMTLSPSFPAIPDLEDKPENTPVERSVLAGKAHGIKLRKFIEDDGHVKIMTLGMTKIGVNFDTAKPLLINVVECLLKRYFEQDGKAAKPVGVPMMAIMRPSAPVSPVSSPSVDSPVSIRGAITEHFIAQNSDSEEDQADEIIEIPRTESIQPLPDNMSKATDHLRRIGLETRSIVFDSFAVSNDFIGAPEVIYFCRHANCHHSVAISSTHRTPTHRTAPVLSQQLLHDLPAVGLWPANAVQCRNVRVQ